MIIPVVLLLLQVPWSNGASCSGSNVSSYVRSEAMTLMEFAAHSLKEVTLNTCADACTNEANAVKCNSFEYDSSSQECSLHPEDGQPLGASVLAKTHENNAFFQRVCIDESHLCPAAYSFERYPQQLLIGHAMEVISTNGLSDCLSVCLSAVFKLGVPCRSVMFYYETGECIVNRETKEEHPHLFVFATGERIVDYFESNCHNVVCYDGWSVHWVRSEEFSISAKKDVIVEVTSIEQCRQMCLSNQIESQRFPCRSFVFSASQNECHLSAESGVSRRQSDSLAIAPIGRGEYFEKFCLNSDLNCGEASFDHLSSRSLRNSTIKVVSTPSVQVCLTECLKEFKCVSVSFDYEQDSCHISDKSQFTHPHLFELAEGVDYFDKTCDGLAPPVTDFPDSSTSSTSLTTSQTENQVSVNVQRGAVTDLRTKQHNNSISIKKSTDASLLKHFDEENFSPTPFPQLVTTDELEERAGYTVGFTGETSLDTQEEEFSSIDMSPEDVENDADPEKAQVKAKLRTECRLDAISVGITFGRPTNGAIFIRDHFDSCRVEFTESISAELVIPFPWRNDESPRCPGEELTPDYWSYVIVVQRNELDNPSLMTANDKTFNITCDYGNVDETLKSSTSSMEEESTSFSGDFDATKSPNDIPEELHGPAEVSEETDAILPEEQPPNPDPQQIEEFSKREPMPPAIPPSRSITQSADRITMSILKDGNPVTTVQLGEEVQLRWNIVENRDDVGYLVSECTAERMGGTSPAPPPLSLIQHGCPHPKVINRLILGRIQNEAYGFSTSMKVFRFDGSRRVRIRCTIDVCLTECPAVDCRGISEEYHRLRRIRQTHHYESSTRRKLPNFRTFLDITPKPHMSGRRQLTTGILSVIDTNFADQQFIATAAGSQFSSSDERVCVLRPIFVGGLTIFFVIFIAQTVAAASFLYERCANRSKDASPYSSSCGISSSGSTSPLVYCPTREIQSQYSESTKANASISHWDSSSVSHSLPSETSDGYTVPTRPRHSWELK